MVTFALLSEAFPLLGNALNPRQKCFNILSHLNFSVSQRFDSRALYFQ